MRAEEEAGMLSNLSFSRESVRSTNETQRSGDEREFKTRRRGRRGDEKKKNYFLKHFVKLNNPYESPQSSEPEVILPYDRNLLNGAERLQWRNMYLAVRRCTMTPILAIGAFVVFLLFVNVVGPYFQILNGFTVQSFIILLFLAVAMAHTRGLYLMQSFDLLANSCWLLKLSVVIYVLFFLLFGSTMFAAMMNLMSRGANQLEYAQGFCSLVYLIYKVLHYTALKRLARLIGEKQMMILAKDMMIFFYFSIIAMFVMGLLILFRDRLLTPIVKDDMVQNIILVAVGIIPAGKFLFHYIYYYALLARVKEFAKGCTVN